MRRFLLTTSILAALGLPASPVFAQATSKVVSACGAQAFTAGTPQYPTMDTTGNACATAAGGSGTAANQVQGNIASGASDAGTNPVKVGAVFNTSPPSVTTGQRVDLQANANGFLRIQLGGIGGGGDGRSPSAAFASDSATPNGNNYPVATLNYLYNGTTVDRAYTIQGVTGTGLGVTAVAIAPTAAASGAIAPTTNTAVGSNQVLKASAGNAYRYAITTGASAGFLMIFDATTAPADGAVTPKICRAVAANTSLELNHAEMPDKFTAGIVEVFSTTGCFTKTASATAELEGWVQ